jgi:hypothetical protein
MKRIAPKIDCEVVLERNKPTATIIRQWIECLVKESLFGLFRSRGGRPLAELTVPISELSYTKHQRCEDHLILGSCLCTHGKESVGE